MAITDDKNNIALYRKQRRSKRLRRRMLALFVVGLVGCTAYLTSPMWLKAFDGIALKVSSMAHQGDEGGFPIRLPDGELQLAAFGDSLAVLTDAHAYVYDAAGVQIKSVQHGFGHPVLQTGGRRLLLYDRGGYGLLMESRLTSTYKKTLDEPIVLARLSGKDYAAVVTQSGSYEPTMRILDSKGEQIFQWKSDYKIQDVAFDRDSAGCVVSTVSAQDGRILTKLFHFRFNSVKEDWSAALQGTLILSLHIRGDDTIAAVGDDRMALYSAKGEQLGSYVYPDVLVGYSHSDMLTALLFEDEGTRKVSIAAVGVPDDEDGVHTLSLDGRVTQVLADGDNVIVLAQGGITRFDETLEQVAGIAPEYDYSKLVRVGGAYYALRVDGIDKLEE